MSSLAIKELIKNWKNCFWHQHACGVCCRKSCSSGGLSDTSANTDREPEVLRRRFRATSPSYQAVVQEQGYTARWITTFLDTWLIPSAYSNKNLGCGLLSYDTVVW